ncbi:TPA: hypothetical protein HA265_01285 [Candidatus Woesearchaeota archaeon]|nr:hypothetical protein [Candidatus Woesearchaeota archaeon]
MSEKEIMDKLKDIEKRVAHIEEMEEEQLDEEKKIESEEEKELSELKEATRKVQFTDIADWQRYIWEGCKYKKEVKESSEVDFFCEKNKGPCRFEGCPLNYADSED